MYFITICTKDRKYLFGNIADLRTGIPEMELNDAGKTADLFWLAIPQHFPSVVLHNHIVMPNHIHGIIELVGNVGAENFLPLPHPFQNSRHKFQNMIPRSVASIVKGYKIGVTKWFREHTDIHDVWQRNYYEHVICNEKAYQSISAYITANPSNWVMDKMYRT